MVNNTSGAINYLAKAGVLPPKNGTNDNIFRTIYPYTIGSKIHFGELDVLYAMEALVDRTLEFLSSNPELDATANSTDYHDLRDADAMQGMDRCVIRNRMAREMYDRAARCDEYGERNNKVSKRKEKKKLKLKVQDPNIAVQAKRFRRERRSAQEADKENPQSASGNGSGSGGKDIVQKFSKLGLSY